MNRDESIPNLLRVPLGARNCVHVGVIPAGPRETEDFEALWNLHPSDFPTIRIGPRSVATPRWQRAYGRAYRFSGQTAPAHAVPEAVLPFLTWVQHGIDGRINGILANWYDPSLKHYIGRHRDSRHGLIEGAPIVTISFGGARVFRMRPWPSGGDKHDIPVADGTVIVLPYETNLSWTHEVAHSATSAGRRVSLTFRAFS